MSMSEATARETAAVEAVALVVNPSSGGGGGDRLALQVSRVLRERGVRIASFETTREEGARPAVEGALRAGFEEIWVLGGDGTVRECLGPIMEADAVLGPLPGGTGNRLVEVIGHSTRVVTQARWMLDQPVHAIDVGVCNDQVFAVRVGVGFEAVAAREVEDDKSGLGNIAYIVAGLRAAREVEPVGLTITGPEGTLFDGEMLAAIFANVPIHALLQVPGLGRPDPRDGKLQAVIISKRPSLEELWRWLRGERSAPPAASPICDISSPSFEATVNGGAVVHLDGESAGRMEQITLQCRPGALHVRGLDLTPGTADDE